MDSRREFLKKAAMLSGASVLPASIARAFEINPAVGTTWRDAEHVVILMQENRSFDHCYGSLRGVRGFDDPRAIDLPDKKPVWFQTDEKGRTFAPFRLNIKDTNATWMGSLPHGWTDQVDARNQGRYDQWLIAKRPGRKEYSEMPLTLGYYNREDLPFYYNLADAFTICDQNFCSSLTGTTPNRLYLWTGKVREDASAPARIRNEETDYGVEAAWKTFPERLEENGISWKIYQNEISVGVGFEGEHDAWLANFTDNPIEWFSQYRVRFHPAYRKNLPKRIGQLKTWIKEGEEKLGSLATGSAEYNELTARLSRGRSELERAQKDLTTYTTENWEKLTSSQKAIHEKAFTTNVDDPAYHDLIELSYDDNGTKRQMKVPKGDVLYQFRKDVNEGTLPTVSWLVAPENFSDHPGAPWYGAWYLSESIDILTKNPEVWKKTIFILCYDENDGYFDHFPPFVPPVPGNDQSGTASKGVDTLTEYVPLEMDLKRKSATHARGSSIGLGYRVPLVIASPWSRGGVVNSQVFDHTSILMFLEKFIKTKTCKEVIETNISSWRRSICGDLTTTFRPYNGEKIAMPPVVQKDTFYETIHKAQFKQLPATPSPLTDQEISSRVRRARQEQGSRTSSALPYELHASGSISSEGTFALRLEAGKNFFGNESLGAPFTLYSLANGWSTRSYAVAAGESINDTFSGDHFLDGMYHLRVDGPNGFFREFKGHRDQMITIDLQYDRDRKGKPVQGVTVQIHGNVNTTDVRVVDNSYGQAIRKGGTVKMDLKDSSGWYDFTVRVEGTGFAHRFAGRVETGKDGISDPLIGRV